jgi:hypothetical protein
MVEFAGPDLAPGDIAGLEVVAADDGQGPVMG